MSGNRSIAAAKNRRSAPERVNEMPPFKNEVQEKVVLKKDIKPRRLTQEERDEIIAKFKNEPVSLFAIIRNQEMRIQSLEDQIELYNKAVFQDLNDRIQAITLDVQSVKSLKKDTSIKLNLDEDKEDSS
jgi:hypothetical protein